MPATLKPATSEGAARWRERTGSASPPQSESPGRCGHHAVVRSDAQDALTARRPISTKVSYAMHASTKRRRERFASRCTAETDSSRRRGRRESSAVAFLGPVEK
jgi:hypothetical protein